MDGIIAYILSKKYVDNSLIGIGAIKGAPCQVESIVKSGNGCNKFTFLCIVRLVKDKVNDN